MMAYLNSTVSFEKMLMKFISEEDPMQSMLKWLCERLMEAEVESKLCAEKSERNKERQGYRSGYRVRRFDTRMGTMYLMCKVLEEYTAANDSLVDGYLVHNEGIHMGVAVAVEKGLIVPVIKNANHKGLMDIHRAVGELARAARDNTLSPDDLTGGTCTISNLGMIFNLQQEEGRIDDKKNLFNLFRMPAI